MTEFHNPALKAFLAAMGAELVLAQVLIRKQENGFELRHVDDREKSAETLRQASESELRAISQFTANGAFRPLKSASNLQTGWRFVVANEIKLEFALNTLYPNAVADWFAVQSGKPPITHYREFTRRQTGMYRITAMLTDAQAVPVIRACCHKNFCLKRRLWTAEGLAPDAPESKSLIPCLEPCAVLLEFARKAMRLEQEKEREITSSLGADKLEIQPSSEIRDADFENPNNPRRKQLEIEKQNVAENRL